MTMMNFADAAAQLRKDGAFYTDPIMCAVADGNWDAQHGVNNINSYRGIVVGDKFFISKAIRIAYQNGYSEGYKRAAKRQKRGW